MKLDLDYVPKKTVQESPQKQYINCASGAQLGEHLPFLPLPCELCSIATDHHVI